MAATPHPAWLERLSAAQAALLPAVRDEWLGVGLATGPADRAAAEAGVRRAYERAGLDPPRVVVWLDSPYQGAYAAAILTSHPQTRKQLLAQADPQLRAQIEQQVGAQVWERVGQQVRAQVWDQARKQVRAQVVAQVRAQVGEQVRTQVMAQVRDQVFRPVLRPELEQGGQLGWAVYGQHDAGWLSFFAAFVRLGQPAPPRLDGLMQVARAAGWWWPFRDLVVLTERPVALHRDPDGRLHHPDGPAIAYPDGFAIHAWHGTRVPGSVLTEPATLQRIHTEPNLEIRRVLRERYGLGRYLREAGAERVHADEFGVLWRLDLPDEAEPLVMVEVVNATPEPDGSRRTYMLRVPPWMRTAREAVAWTFQLDTDDYTPTVQT